MNTIETLTRRTYAPVQELTNDELWQIAGDTAYHSARRSEALREAERRRKPGTELESIDLETVDCYMAVCWECKTATIAYESKYDAMAHATEQGFRVVDGEVYCRDHVDLAIERFEEEQDEAAYTAAVLGGK